MRQFQARLEGVASNPSSMGSFPPSTHSGGFPPRGWGLRAGTAGCGLGKGSAPSAPRAFEDEKKARMGVVECAKHELLQPFNVLYEKEGECRRSRLPAVGHHPRGSGLPARWARKGGNGGSPGAHPIPALAGEFVAQFKFTVLLMPNGPMRITGGPFEPDLYRSAFEVQDAELKVGAERPGAEPWNGAGKELEGSRIP